MCGRSTYKLTWEEIVRLYRLTLDQPPQNTRARYNVCPTTTIDTIVGQERAGRTVPHFGRQVTHPGVDDEIHSVGPICSAGACAMESSSQPLPRMQEL
jgi:putative SOS response-associated peptidase YedK